MFKLLKKDQPAAGTGDAPGVPAVSTVTTRASLVKVYTLIAAVTFLALGVSYLFSVKSFALGSLALVGFVVFAVIQTLTLKRFADAVMASALAALGLSTFLIQNSLYLAAASWGVLTVFFILVHLRARHELDNVVRLKFSRLTRPVIGLLFTAMALYLGFVFFASGSFFLEQQTVDKIIDVTFKPVMEKLVRGFSSSMPMDDFLAVYAEGGLSKQIPNFDQLSQFQKNRAVQQATAGLVETVSSTAKFQLKLDQTVGENVKAYVAAKTEGLSAKSRPLRLTLLLLVLILAVKSVEFILFYPFMLIAFVIYELLIAMGFIVVQFESRSKEVLNLP